METKTNIKEFKGYTSITPLAKKIEVHKKIIEWKKGATYATISIKRKSVAKAFKEFVDLYDVKEYFSTFWNDCNRKDDSVKVYFK